MRSTALDHSERSTSFTRFPLGKASVERDLGRSLFLWFFFFFQTPRRPPNGPSSDFRDVTAYEFTKIRLSRTNGGASTEEGNNNDSGSYIIKWDSECNIDFFTSWLIIIDRVGVRTVHARVFILFIYFSNDSDCCHDCDNADTYMRVIPSCFNVGNVFKEVKSEKQLEKRVFFRKHIFILLKCF